MARRWSFWMTPMEHRVIRWLDDQFRGLLMPMGQVLIWVIVAACLLQVLDGSTLRYDGAAPLLVVTIAFASGALIGAILLGLFFRPRLTLTRRLPAPPAAGEIISYRVLVKNSSARTARQIVVQERGLPAEVRPHGEPPIIDVLRPGESAEVTLQISCVARGAFMLPRLQAASAFPSGLWKSPRRGGIPPERLLVYPRITQLDRLNVPLGREYQPGGVASASQIGESTEFLGTREWRQGDRLRDLHWPSFARTGKPIVKEYQEEYFVRVALVIDTEVHTAREEALFERGLSFAAGAAHTLAREDAIIDLMAAGKTVYRFQAGRSLAHVEQVLEVLACVEPAYELDVAAVEAALIPEARQLSAVLFVFVRWDARRAALVRQLQERGVAVRVLTLRPDRQPEELLPEEKLVLP